MPVPWWLRPGIRGARCGQSCTLHLAAIHTVLSKPVMKKVGYFHFLNLPSIQDLDEMARDIALIEPNPVD